MYLQYTPWETQASYISRDNDIGFRGFFVWMHDNFYCKQKGVLILLLLWATTNQIQKGALTEFTIYYINRTIPDR